MRNKGQSPSLIARRLRNRSRYQPTQGLHECMRRVGQILRGQLLTPLEIDEYTKAKYVDYQTRRAARQPQRVPA